MKLDSKKSKAAVKNSAVKQKKVKAKAANPAKAPKVKKTLNTKKAQKVNNKPKGKGKKQLCWVSKGHFVVGERFLIRCRYE